MGNWDNLADVLRSAGLAVYEHDGWQNRAAKGAFNPKGNMLHWDASRSGVSPGVPSYLVRGAVSHLWHCRGCNVHAPGVHVIGAGGRANHAGIGRWPGITSGNTSFWGHESDWTIDEDPGPIVDSMVKACHAMNMNYGYDPNLTIAHSEWAPDRKSDITAGSFGQNMTAVRLSVASGGTAPTTPQPPVPSQPSGAYPKFPLPSGHYFGPKSGPASSHSGYYSNADKANLGQWQRRMRDRGWTIGVDGLYGPQTADVAKKFQKQVGLTQDGLIGKNTWDKAWTAPIT